MPFIFLAQDLKPLPVAYYLIADSTPQMKPSDQALKQLAKSISSSMHGDIEVSDMPKVLHDLIATLLTSYPNLEFTDLLNSTVHTFDLVLDYTDTDWLPDPVADPVFKALARPFCTVIILEKMNLNPLPHSILTSPSEEDVNNWTKSMIDEFKDGFDWNDLAKVTSNALYFCRHYNDLTQEQKCNLIKLLIFSVIDQVPIPFLPHCFSHKVFKQFVNPIVDLLVCTKN
jgi:hypothetical protein